MLLEDYGTDRRLQTAALVGRDGSVDWLCFPRFDSASCFAALLGDERHGHWSLAPAGDIQSTSRRYRPGTLILETEFKTAEGVVRLIDFMPRRGDGPPRLMRIVEGLSGRVPMRMRLVAATRLRRGRRLGGARRRRGAGDRGPGRLPPEHGAGAADPRRDIEADFVLDEDARERLDADLASLLRGDPAGRGRRLGARPHRGVVARVDRAQHLRRASTATRC